MKIIAIIVVLNLERLVIHQLKEKINVRVAEKQYNHMINFAVPAESRTKNLLQMPQVLIGFIGLFKDLWSFLNLFENCYRL